MEENLIYDGKVEMVVEELKVKSGSLISQGKLVMLYKEVSSPEAVKKFKCNSMGRVVKVLVKKGDKVSPGSVILKYSGGCQHPTIMKDMCAECGADLRKLNLTRDTKASVAMVHAIPELKVSDTEAKSIGQEDQSRLLHSRKLVLLVDLDQTVIHTTNDDIPPNLKDVHHFQLYGERSPWYHTRIRPGTFEFLKKISSLYELHICTFGARLYAHTIAAFLDPDKKYFSHRILSRDECFDARSKTANMSALFPCGDSMVCIIDDREDVWNFAPNLVHVKPYHFFKHTGDINAPPGLTKKENDDKVGVNLDKIKQSPKPTLDFKGKIDKLKNPLNEVETGEKDHKDEENNSDLSKDEEKLKEPKDSIDMPVVEGGVEGEKVDHDEKEENNEDKSNDAKEVNNKDISNDLDISDSEDSNSKSNLSSKRVSEADNKDKTDKVDVDDPDDYLLYLEDILKTIHQAFYDLYDQSQSDSKVPAPDLKTVIPYVKRKVLAGVVLVFSGVVPTHVPVERSKPFLLAKSLGASVRSSIDRSTTHLVAARVGTAKVNEARKLDTGIQIVTPDWLWNCSERWERVSEDLFTLTKTSNITRRPPAHCSSPEIAFAQRCEAIDLNLDGNSVYSRQPSVVEANPFLTFSSDDLAGMDKEVEDILSGESESSDDEDDEVGRTGDGSSSEDSLTGTSRGHKRKLETIMENDEFDQDSNLETPMAKFKKGEQVPSDYEFDQQSDDDSEDDDDIDDVDAEGGDWSLMGAALEKELE